MEERELTEKIIGCAMKVHSVLGPGFLESVYAKALAHELRKAGLKVECEKQIIVTYDGVVVGGVFSGQVGGRKGRSSHRFGA
jgi:GxxExxY protein